MITISFNTQQLHDDCVNLQRADLLLGSVNAEALVTFLSDAAAFENVGELIAFFGEEVKINLDDSLSVAIGYEYRAAFVVVGKRFTTDANGRINWYSVTRLKLLEISRLP